MKHVYNILDGFSGNQPRRVKNYPRKIQKLPKIGFKSQNRIIPDFKLSESIPFVILGRLTKFLVTAINSSEVIPI